MERAGPELPKEELLSLSSTLRVSLPTKEVSKCLAMFCRVRAGLCSGGELPPGVFTVRSQGGVQLVDRTAAYDTSNPVYLGILEVRLFLLQTLGEVLVVSHISNSFFSRKVGTR